MYTWRRAAALSTAMRILQERMHFEFPRIRPLCVLKTKARTNKVSRLLNLVVRYTDLMSGDHVFQHH